MPTEPPVSAIVSAWLGLTCRPLSGVGPIAPDPSTAVCDSSNGFVATLTACFAMSSVACATIADEAQPITGADHFGAEFSQPIMGDGARLEIADVVGRVMHELHVPDAPPMRLLQPFQLPLEKVEPLHIGNNRRLSRQVRGFEIGGIQRAAHAMIGNQLIPPGEAVEVVPVKLAQCRGSHHSEGPFRIAPEHGPVRHVNQARDRQRSGAHRVCEIGARRRIE